MGRLKPVILLVFTTLYVVRKAGVKWKREGFVKGVEAVRAAAAVAAELVVLGAVRGVTGRWS